MHLVSISIYKFCVRSACQEEKARAEVEKKGREEVLAAKVSLENEISALKSEISILQRKKGGSNAQSIEEVKLLDIRVTENEREIKRLKGEVEKEKIRAESEKKNAEVEKKRAAEAWKCVEAEKGKAEEERRRANIEGKKAEEYKLQLEALRKEAVEEERRRAKLVLESSKLGDMTKKLESEKQKVSKEKKRANNEGKKAEEYRIQLEALRKEADDAKLMLVSEASKSEAVSKKLEAEKQMVCKERQRANIEGKKAEEYRLQLEALRREADDAKSMLVSEASKSEALRKKLEAEKQMLSKEREHAHLEMAKAEDQRKLAEASRKQAEEEKRHAERLSQQLEEAGRRIVELQNDLVSGHSVETHGCKPDTDAGFLKMKNGSKVNTLQKVGEEPNLGLEIMKFEEASRRCGVDKEKSVGGKELSDLEMIKPQEHRKVVQGKCLAADHLSQQLEEARGRIDELQKQIHDLHSSRKSFDASAIQVDKYVDSGKAKLLKKQLKFEKMQVKHAKQVAKLEKDRNIILHQELGRLKVDFAQFLHRLDTVDQCFSSNTEGTDNLGNVKVSYSIIAFLNLFSEFFSTVASFVLYGYGIYSGKVAYLFWLYRLIFMTKIYLKAAALQYEHF